MIIDKPGCYRTSSGEMVRVIYVDASGLQPIIGLKHGTVRPLMFCENGSYDLDGLPHSLDLVSIWSEPKPKMKLWRYKIKDNVPVVHAQEEHPGKGWEEFKITRDMIEE